ncbi:MAG: hypothetical protein PHC95_14210 [Parabacteroides sp.]|nr:hypothetical protein [Parabacteroides sp.]
MKKLERSETISLKEKLGDFFIDIAKLVFAGVVLSTLLDFTEDKVLILILGIVSTVIMLIMGFESYKE